MLLSSNLISLRFISKQIERNVCYFMDYKNKFISNVTDVVNILKGFSNLYCDNISDDQISKCLLSINDVVNSGLKEITEDLNFLIDNTRWETFNIAFFGETNAGKSTLIEALIRGDGKLIGDGSKDYTKSLTSIKFGNVNLLDMPGIEGEEDQFTSEIIKTIEKAHIIFYVISGKKEPEEGTIEKVKKYLKGKAKVYSVLNVRGKPSAYKYNKVLVDEDTKKVDQRISSKIKQILGNQYKGNIILNAELGYLSVGMPEKDELIKYKNKILDAFSTFEEAYEFSNVNKFEELIFSLLQDSKNEIIISNTYKFINVLEKITISILKDKKNFDNMLKILRNNVDNADKRIQEIIDKYDHEIINTISIYINKVKNDIIKTVDECIENKDTETKIKKEVEKVVNRYKDEIQDKLNELLSDMNSEVESMMKELHQRIDLSINFGGFDSKLINIRDILSQISISFKYVIREVIDVGLNIFSNVWLFTINPLIAIITTIGSIFKKVYDWFFRDPKRREREAKKKAYEEIDNTINKVKDEMVRNVEREIKILKTDVLSKFNMMYRLIEAINKVKTEMDTKINDIIVFKVNLCSLLASEVINKKIEIAYLDLELNKLLVIGEDLPNDVKDIFRVNQFYNFNTFGELIYNINCRIENKFIVLDDSDEFIYRALSASINYYNKKYHNRKNKSYIKGIRRKKSS